MSSELVTYAIVVLLDGKQQATLDVPTFGGVKVAERRAKWAWIHHYGQDLDNLDRVTTKIKGRVEA
jgi:hypothetical protein